MRISSRLYYSVRKKWACVFVLICVCAAAVAQEYKYEIGGGAGMSAYMGDANKTSPFLGLQPSGGAIFRRNLNFRWALKADLLMGKVSGDTKNTDNVFPNNAQVAFERSFYELGGQAEFNFLPYSDKFAYLQTSKISPYVLGGFGFTYASGGDSFFSPHLSLGVGVKYKIKNRVNLGFEYSFRKLFSDAFDAPDKSGFNLDNPYDMNSSFMKNNDWYSVALFSITWDFGPNNGFCNNSLVK